MGKSANDQANNVTELPSIGHRIGKPKGYPKPAGSGRKPGTPNRATRDVREAAAKHSAKAIATLVRLLKDPDTRVQATAAREILDRAHGRPRQDMGIDIADDAAVLLEAARKRARGA